MLLPSSPSLLPSNFSLALNLLEKYDRSKNSNRLQILFFLNGIAGMVISCFGLLGNLLSGFVLKRKSMGSISTYSYLTALATIDFFFVLSNVVLHVHEIFLFSSVFIEPSFIRKIDETLVLNPLTTEFDYFFDQSSPPPYYIHVFPYMNPVAYTLQVCSVWLTVAFTVDRYIMICLPFKANNFCNVESARKVIISLMIFCFLFNLPKFFEYKIDYVNKQSSIYFNKVSHLGKLYKQHSSNSSVAEALALCLKSCLDMDYNFEKVLTRNHKNEESSSNMSPSLDKIANVSKYYDEAKKELERKINFSLDLNFQLSTSPPFEPITRDSFRFHSRLTPEITLTTLGNNNFFKSLYHFGFYIIFIGGLPFVLLFFLNARLMIEVSSVWRRRFQMMKTMTNGEKRRIDTTIMLISVVVVFFLCQTPALVSRTYWAYADLEMNLNEAPLFVLNEVGNLLILLNSSINILPYYFFGKKFREEFIKTIKCWKKKGDFNKSSFSFNSRRNSQMDTVLNNCYKLEFPEKGSGRSRNSLSNR